MKRPQMRWTGSMPPPCRVKLFCESVGPSGTAFVVVGWCLGSSSGSCVHVLSIFWEHNVSSWRLPWSRDDCWPRIIPSLSLVLVEPTPTPWELLPCLDCLLTRLVVCAPQQPMLCTQRTEHYFNGDGYRAAAGAGKRKARRLSRSMPDLIFLLHVGAGWCVLCYHTCPIARGLCMPPQERKTS